MPRVVSNASTLIHLAGIGKLELLWEFFGQVLIPVAVWREVVEEGKGRQGAAQVASARAAGWIEVSAPRDQALLRLLERELDAGEAEAIALALEVSADLLLVDESEARRIAELYGLRRTGAIGLLLRAKREGKIASLRDELTRLRHEAGFWIDEDLLNRVLDSAGESSA